MANTFGVLLHPTVLPGTPFCGTFGASARHWLKLLANSGVGIWQILPLTPTDSTGSPYNSPSSFALNKWFLDVEDLIKDGFLPNGLEHSLYESRDNNSTVLNFKMSETRSDLIGNYLIENWDKQNYKTKEYFYRWKRINKFWLEDYFFHTT